MRIPKVLLGVFVSAIPHFVLATYTESTIDLKALTVKHYQYGEIETTQTQILKHTEELSLEKSVWSLVSAKTQTKGQGFRGRSWDSHRPGNVYVTFGVPLEWNQIGKLPWLTALTILDTLENFGIKDPKIRWPNAIIVNDHKIAGVLTTLEPIKDFVVACIGIGINVSMSPEQCKTIDYPATSLLCELGKAPATKDVIQMLTENLHKRLNLIDLQMSFKEYDNALAYKNQSVDFYDFPEVDLDKVTGNHKGTYSDIKRSVFKGVTPKGKLILQYYEDKPFSTGEIRPKEHIK
jgi:biotin-[acetyl-CoA-carboxylase] ligase BirA-like protein